MLVRKYAVSVLAAHSFALDEPAFLQILNDPLNGALRNTDIGGNLPKHEMWV